MTGGFDLLSFVDLLVETPSLEEAGWKFGSKAKVIWLSCLRIGHWFPDRHRGTFHQLRPSHSRTGLLGKLRVCHQELPALAFTAPATPAPSAPATPAPSTPAPSTPAPGTPAMPAPTRKRGRKRKGAGRDASENCLQANNFTQCGTCM